MNPAFARAPHSEGMPHNPASIAVSAPNAALLIDFDNVTMGMRSDLSKELKNLLRSDIIRGKVTVQRAYADWRRYPQYIVPLSEASIDLIFAPAYGSSKKNATDIRMAIDGMELVFTRPEIGTYILLTGDSDFSSLVLKLKEYGKYVIGVGIQESSSDILVQNCDEYYSYTSLTGLRKTGDDGRTALDPWVLVEKAVEQMVKRKDVMRSDRLKQVMLEIDSGFDEKSFGFSKFSRFLSEASQKGLLQLRKLENGQFEIHTGSEGRDGGRESRGRDRNDRGKESRSRSDERRGGRGRGEAAEAEPTPTAEPATAPEAAPPRAEAPSTPVGEAGAPGRKEFQPAYDLMIRALKDLLEDQEGEAVRDSDVKRRMLAIDESFDEATLGFSKFSLFLRQAHDHEVIDLRKTEGGNYEMALPSKARERGRPRVEEAKREEPKQEEAKAAEPASRDRAPAPSGKAPARREEKEEEPDSARRLRPRLSARRRGGKDEPPPLLEGQAVAAPTASSSRGDKTEAQARPGKGKKGEAAPSSRPAPSGKTGVDVEALRLPTDAEAVVQYLTNSYKGVGKKTAETLVEALGDRLFPTLQESPDRVRELLPPARAEKVLEGWAADFARRGQEAGGSSAAPDAASEGGEAGESGSAGGGGRRRGGRRTRGGGRGSR